MPAISGPRPIAPVLIAELTSAARRGSWDGSSSASAAVAVPCVRPAENPERNLATSSTATPFASRNPIVLATATANAASSTLFRPI
jgi:hypothetical protein